MNRKQAVFADTLPYFRLSELRRATLEAEAKALRAEIATPNLNAVAKTRAELRLREIERLLALDDRGSGLLPDRASKDHYVQQCRAGQTFTHPRSGRVFEHGCTCGQHVEVLTGNERQEREREGLIEEQCKGIQRAAQRAQEPRFLEPKPY
jgi:hypothetical protein